MKTPMYCIDGPWQGATLWLDAQNQYTLPLNIGGVIGRYYRGLWKPVAK